MAEQVRDYAIFLLDPDGNIISWNTGAQSVKQYTAQEAIGRHFSIFYTAEDKARDWPAQELRRAAAEGRIEDEGWRVRRDGSMFWANVVITALRGEDGSLLAYSKITRDLTERKRQEESLRQSEQGFRLLVDGVQDYAIYMLSPEGMVTSWNVGASRIKGYEAREIIGQHVSRFYSEEDIAAGKPQAELAMAREHGRAEEQGWRVRRDGSRFWARVVVTPLLDSAGTLHGFAKVTQDLTQQRQSEALEAASGNVNNFIAVLAHELRNPLAPIRNAVYLQKMARPGDPKWETSRQIIDRQSSQLARIVDDLLDISRITRGTLAVDRQPTDVANIINRAVETSRPGVEAARHQLQVDLSAQPLWVSADELRLTQALTNLINNAVRYTDPGGQIFVTAARTGSQRQPQVRITVRDTGRGIAADFLGSIFGMFVQGKDPLNRPAAGLGVGLALARSLVELHHGTLEAASPGLGQGAEFTIRLPFLEVAQGVSAAPAPAMRAPAAGPPRRILVVDDNVDAAVALASLLGTQGHQVRALHDGAQAIAACEQFQPEIVLLDIGMPGMNGLEVARHLRAGALRPRPLLVAVTGWNKPEDQVRSREAGFDLHLVKPVEQAQIDEILAARTQLGL